MIVCYYRSWYTFEIILTISLWVPLVVLNTNVIIYMEGLYVLRIVGALQYLGWMKDLQLIFRVLTATVYGITLILVLVIVAFIYFAVAGVLLFKNSDPFHFSTFWRRYDFFLFAYLNKPISVLNIVCAPWFNY